MKSLAVHNRHYPALDGLRGLAILLVIFHHNFKFLNYFYFGWLGVDLFFVLSGFLITDILLNSLEQPHFLRNFYARRMIRIFPVYYLALILCLFLLPSIPSLAVDARYYQENQGWLWAYLQNWLFVFREPYGDPVLLHTWSLAVEEQFYLLWPLMILLIRKPKPLLWFLITVLVLLVVCRYFIWTLRIKDLAYSSLYTFTRIDGLLIGAILAVMMRRHLHDFRKFIFAIVLFMAVLNFGFYFMNDSGNAGLPYLALAGYTTFAVLFGLLVYEGVSGDSRIMRILFENRFMKFFGKISYGLYVYHWPVYLLLFEPSRNWITERNLIPPGLVNILCGLLVTIAGVLIAVVSYHFFERPLLAFKKRFR